MSDICPLAVCSVSAGYGAAQKSGHLRRGPVSDLRPICVRSLSALCPQVMALRKLGIRAADLTTLTSKEDASALLQASACGGCPTQPCTLAPEPCTTSHTAPGSKQDNAYCLRRPRRGVRHRGVRHRTSKLGPWIKGGAKKVLT